VRTALPNSGTFCIVSLRDQAIPVFGSALAGLALVLLMGLLRGERPNVVVIVVDTLRADAVSMELGNDETPHIAELAAEGTHFPLAFSHAPMTLPAHASLFSGRHPYETGVYNNGEEVPDDVPLLAEVLSSRGYQTAAAVSLATLWPLGDRRGLDRGFDTFDTGSIEVSPADETTKRISSVLDKLDTDRPFFLFAHLADPHEPYREHAPWFQGDVQSNRAEVSIDGTSIGVISTSNARWWEQAVELTPGEHEIVLRSDNPFKLRSFGASGSSGDLETILAEGELLTASSRVSLRVQNSSTDTDVVNLRLWLNDVPETKSIRGRYASEVRAADAAIGKLIAQLRERGMYDNTIFVVTSDHGEALGERGIVGHVINLYDELLHVPLVIRLPWGERDERLKAADGNIVRHVDLAPTLLDYLNIDGLEGASGASLFRRAERVLIAETHPPEAPKTLMAMRDATYKLVFDPEEDSFQMFRLGPDPLELDNVFRHQGHLRKTWELVLRKLATKIDPVAQHAEDVQRRLTALGY